MKKEIFFYLVIIMFFSTITTLASECYSVTVKMCKENMKEECREYDDFLAFFYNERNWKVHLDFFSVPKYKVTEDGSKHDPLVDEFYE